MSGTSNVFRNERIAGRELGRGGYSRFLGGWSSDLSLRGGGVTDNVFSRHLHSLPLGRTEIPNSLFIIMESFAFVAACFIHCVL